MNRHDSILLEKHKNDPGTVSILLPESLDIESLVEQYPTIDADT